MYDFRDQLIAASLKQSCVQVSISSVEFPRSADRGLIEAASACRANVQSRDDFRDQLIAASLKHALGTAQSCTGRNFRDQLIAASLKRSQRVRTREHGRTISAIS